jgi:D-alanyl-D-alanine dipeptidase
MRPREFLSAAAALLLLILPQSAALAQSPPADDPLVDLATVDPTILVELRYATTRNIAGRALYPAGARCIVRRHVAEGLKAAQDWLRPRGYALKIWDGYRTPEAQLALWELSKNRSFVASPDNGHSLHTWGAAVDATLVDAAQKEARMPTDFDDFTAAAAMQYRGGDPVIARNLVLLQQAMARGGFVGMRTEWWHFVGKRWRSCKQVQVDSLLPGQDGRWSAPPAAAVPPAAGRTVPPPGRLPAPGN